MLLFSLTLTLLTALLTGGCLPANSSNTEQFAGRSPQTDSIPLESDQSAVQFSTDYLMGKFDPASHPAFTRVSLKYTAKENLYLRKDAYQAFVRMAEAARKEGIVLKIVSATRNFESQKRIWEDKWSGRQKVENGQNVALAYPDPVQRALKILEYSSMPGSSRHHWGTDVDLNNLTNEYFETGKGAALYSWMTRHAASYGFCQPYTAKGPLRPEGYHEEKWHWSYQPVSALLTQQCRLHLKDTLIKGFLGAETVGRIGIVKNYVLGINQGCAH